MVQIVSFDFDSTLSRPDVQEYAVKLINEGIDVWVVTSRYDDLHKHMWSPNPEATNNELWEVIDRIGLPRWKVMFTNMTDKSLFLARTKIIWHLDDDNIELFNIRDDKAVNTIGVQVNAGSWKQKCQRLLKKHKEAHDKKT